MRHLLGRGRARLVRRGARRHAVAAHVGHADGERDTLARLLLVVERLVRPEVVAVPSEEDGLAVERLDRVLESERRTRKFKDTWHGVVVGEREHEHRALAGVVRVVEVAAEAPAGLVAHHRDALGEEALECRLVGHRGLDHLERLHGGRVEHGPVLLKLSHALLAAVLARVPAIVVRGLGEALEALIPRELAQLRARLAGLVVDGALGKAVRGMEELPGVDARALGERLGADVEARGLLGGPGLGRVGQLDHGGGLGGFGHVCPRDTGRGGVVSRRTLAGLAHLGPCLEVTDRAWEIWS